MATQSTPSIVASFSEPIGSDDMSVALIGPNQGLRHALANSLGACHGGPIQEISEYPASIDDLPKLLEQGYDIIMIEWDHDPEYTLDLVEAICGQGKATVMVYSEQPDPEMSDPDLLKRCMRAGAREFLSVPIGPDAMTEALVRAAARRPSRNPATDGGRLFVFCGVKGGVGVTSVACTFALALAQESKDNTLLVDLVLPFGDAALKFGLQPHYSTLDALNSRDRLDPTLLSQLVVKHPSGLSILGASGKPMEYKPDRDVVDKLISVARQSYANVVVDAGSQFDVYSREEHFRESSSVFLVAQSGISEIRNANRLITQYFGSEKTSLKIILNRYEAGSAGVSDEEIRKALTRTIDWKIPNDQLLLRRMQEPSTPMTLSESPMAVEFLSMARSICGKPENTRRKKGFSLGQIARTLSFKTSESKTSESKTSESKTSESKTSESSNPLRVVPETPQFVRAAATESTKAQETSSERSANPLGLARNTQSSNISTLDDTSSQTRIYQGKTYVKGPDAKWHLLEVQIEELDQKPSIDWESPDAIVFGTPLSKEHFNARASVPGSFMYVPSEGYVLPVGAHTLWATFIPAQPSSGSSVQKSVAIAVLKATPLLTWSTPLAITSGTPLGETQLNTSSSVPGEFTYVPEPGTVLPAGKHLLSVEFAPMDGANYTSVEAEVSINVLSATPAIAWATPVAITFGTPLSNVHLCAASEVPGSFTYSPESGAVLSVGAHTLSVLFSPADPINYAPANAEVSIAVAKADPVITWSTPRQLTYGTPLTDAELNAVASIEGRLVYIPPPRALLSAGSHKLAAVFTPKDRASFNTAHSQVSIEVYQAIPRLQWVQPGSISYGTPLTDLELNATASVPGTFDYSPAEGELLPEGTHPLTLRFTPADTLNYTVAQARVQITVTKAPPASVEWNLPSPICYGTPLTPDQICASAAIPGEFVYSPREGTVLPAGKQQLAVVFTPADTQIPPTAASVELEISKAKPSVTWSQPENITYGTVLAARQLNASASIPGGFQYDPHENTCLPAGKHQLAARFNPTDRLNYEDVQTGTSITVAKATPHLEWPAPEPVPYGLPLGTAQFKPTSSVAGSFIYSPELGTVLPVGVHRIMADFKPADENNYRSSRIDVPLVVQELNDFSSLPESILAAQMAPQPSTSSAKLVEFRPRQEPSEQSGSREPARTGRDTVSQPAGTSNSQHGTAADGNGVSSANAPETRTYKGQTYRKGADGQWHLQ